VPILDAAQGLYRDFIAKAGSTPEYADGVKRAQERIKDIDDIKKFILEGIKAAEEAPPPMDTPGGLEGTKEGEGGDKPADKPADKPEEKKP
jgi:hypothetical protein